MKRASVLLPDGLARILQIESERRGVSTSQLIREAVAAVYMNGGEEVRGIRSLIGAFSGGPPHDAARHVDEILAGMVDDIARDAGLAPRDS